MRRTATTLTLSLAALALVSGCTRNSNGPTEGPAMEPSPSVPVSALPTVTTPPAEPSPAKPRTQTDEPTPVTASPGPDQTDALLSGLAAISPGLAQDRDAAVRAAAAVCRQIVRGDGPARLSSSAGMEFSATAAEPLTDEQSRAVVDVVRTTFCHS